MAKLVIGAKVRILHHSTNPSYIGLEGNIHNTHCGFGPATRPVSGAGRLPDPASKEKYDVQIQGNPGLVVTYLDKEWLELL